MTRRAGWLAAWKRKADQYTRQVYAVYLAWRHPRTPWYARAFLGLVVAYAFSPVDLIPDFIPVLGLLDDYLLIPLGVLLAMRLVPRDVMAECQAQAQALPAQDQPRLWLAVVAVALFWVAVILILALVLARRRLQ